MHILCSRLNISPLNKNDVFSSKSLHPVHFERFIYLWLLSVPILHNQIYISALSLCIPKNSFFFFRNTQSTWLKQYFDGASRIHQNAVDPCLIQILFMKRSWFIYSAISPKKVHYVDHLYPKLGYNVILCFCIFVIFWHNFLFFYLSFSCGYGLL